MFMDCTSLVGGAGTVYDSNFIHEHYAHVDEGRDYPGYLTSVSSLGVTTNISEPVLQPTTDQPMYNVAGQRIGKDYKGIVVINGKKTVVK